MDWKNISIYKNKDKDNAGCFIDADVQYPKKLLELHNDFPSFPWQNENLKHLIFCNKFSRQERICYLHKKFK